MTDDRLALLDRLATESRAVARELLAGVEGADATDLADADLCLSVPYPSPSEEGACAFVDAVLAWLRDGSLDPLADWLSGGERVGLLSYLVALSAILPRIASEAGHSSSAEWVATRVTELASMLSPLVDVHLTRGHQCVGLVATYLEAIHRLGSPLSVITMQADLATAALEEGRLDAVQRHLQEALDACDTVIRMRRNVGDDTPVWAHALRHLHPPQGESLA
jgi:hypothetical protein